MQKSLSRRTSPHVSVIPYGDKAQIWAMRRHICNPMSYLSSPIKFWAYRSVYEGYFPSSLNGQGTFYFFMFWEFLFCYIPICYFTYGLGNPSWHDSCSKYGISFFSSPTCDLYTSCYLRFKLGQYYHYLGNSTRFTWPMCSYPPLLKILIQRVSVSGFWKSHWGLYNV